MKHVGYGVTKNGEPAGIWPVPLAYAQTSVERYRENDKLECVWAIVPISIGDPISATAASSG